VSQAVRQIVALAGREAEVLASVDICRHLPTSADICQKEIRS
jgi:hypothetical protein